MAWSEKDRKIFIDANPNYQEEYYIKNRDKKIEYRHQYERDNKERLTKEYSTRWQKRKKEYDVIMHNLKINGCAICGYNKCIDSLDFHHVNPEDKEFQIGKRTLDWSVERVANELNKCILLCKNCHYELHYKERNIKYMERENMEINKNKKVMTYF